MKKIMGLAIAVLMTMVLAGCATGSAAQTAAAQQNRKNNLPDWCGITFTSDEAPDVWGGFVKEKGLFASGESNFGDRRTATSTADLNAKAQIAQKVEQIISSYEGNTRGTDSEGNTTEGFAGGTASVVSKKISGIRRVDRYIADDGYVYVLMFVSNSDIQKAADDTSMSEYQKNLMKTLFPIAENVGTDASLN